MANESHVFKTLRGRAYPFEKNKTHLPTTIARLPVPVDPYLCEGSF